MAEKRGNFVYNDDGTISQLVEIAGASSTGTGLGVTTNDILPYERQATLVNTAVTHTGQVIPNGTSNTQATWTQVPDGMSEFVMNLSSDVGATTIITNVFWSEDGTNNSGRSVSVLPSSSATQKTSVNWLAVGGAFYKVEIQNGDAAPRTCTANIKFRP